MPLCLVIHRSFPLPALFFFSLLLFFFLRLGISSWAMFFWVLPPFLSLCFFFFSLPGATESERMGRGGIGHCM